MATWTNLDASVDAGDPITTTLMQGLKDNPAAIVEGAAGAPQFSTTNEAFAARATGTSYNGGFVEAKIGYYNTNGAIMESLMDSDSEANQRAKSYVWRVGRTGQYLLHFGVIADNFNGSPQVTHLVRINEVADATLQFTGVTESSGFQSAQKLVTLNVGDKVDIWAKYTSGSSSHKQWWDSRLYVYTDNPFIHGGGYALAIGYHISDIGAASLFRPGEAGVVDNGGVSTALATWSKPN